jgi:RHS repeat-associated protein
MQQSKKSPMTLDFTGGGRYLIILGESNSSVLRLLTNDIIGMDDEYYGYQSTFFNGQKVNNLVSVGTVGGGGGGNTQNSVGDEPVMLNSAPSITPNLVDTRATTYGYALDGRRVSKAGVVNLTYLYDGENVIYEIWDNKLVRFTHPSASACGQKCGGGCGGGKLIFVDHPISITIGTMKYYYLYDGLGSVTELIDINQNVVNTYRYTPFGDALVKQETVYNPHQFTGRQYDAESGLYHYRARAYSPDIGRFMQQDPAGMVDGANMYAYVVNNPVNYKDSSGNSLTFWGWTSDMNKFYKVAQALTRIQNNFYKLYSAVPKTQLDCMFNYLFGNKPATINYNGDRCSEKVMGLPMVAYASGGAVLCKQAFSWTCIGCSSIASLILHEFTHWCGYGETKALYMTGLTWNW